MSDESTIERDDGNLTAAEYVLRLLGDDERRAVERRLSLEPALSNDVAFWEGRLANIAAGIEPVTPPATVWQRIEAALGASMPRQHGGVWQNVSFWRWSAIGSAAIAAASVATLATIVRVPPPRAPLVATLDTSGQASFVAAIDPSRNSLTIVPAALTNAGQRSLELWLIAPGEQPRSLGLVEPGRPVRVNVPRDLVTRVAADAVLAITVEPVGGSPTGLPTGPIIANGKLTSL